MAGNDAAAVARVIAGGVPDDGLKHAGQAVLRRSTSSEFLVAATALIDSLSRRDWSGDPELIAELVHARDRTTPELALLAVDLDELGEALDESSTSVSYIGFADAAVWPGELFDVGQGREDFDAYDSDRWLPVVGAGSRAAQAVMERFIATIDSPGLARDCTPRSTGPVPLDASRQSSAVMTTSTPAGIDSVTMPASGAPEHGSPITVIDPPADPSERLGGRHRSGSYAILRRSRRRCLRTTDAILTYAGNRWNVTAYGQCAASPAALALSRRNRSGSKESSSSPSM